MIICCFWTFHRDVQDKIRVCSKSKKISSYDSELLRSEWVHADEYNKQIQYMNCCIIYTCLLMLRYSTEKTVTLPNLCEFFPIATHILYGICGLWRAVHCRKRLDDRKWSMMTLSVKLIGCCSCYCFVFSNKMPAFRTYMSELGTFSTCIDFKVKNIIVLRRNNCSLIFGKLQCLAYRMSCRKMINVYYRS